MNTGNPSIVKLLLEAGVDVNQMNTECNGAMPLHLAIMQGRLKFRVHCFISCHGLCLNYLKKISQMWWFSVDSILH